MMGEKENVYKFLQNLPSNNKTKTEKQLHMILKDTTLREYFWDACTAIKQDWRHYFVMKQLNYEVL
jgi:hypothetical protein